MQELYEVLFSKFFSGVLYGLHEGLSLKIC